MRNNAQPPCTSCAAPATVMEAGSPMCARCLPPVMQPCGHEAPELDVATGTPCASCSILLATGVKHEQFKLGPDTRLPWDLAAHTALELWKDNEMVLDSRESLLAGTTLARQRALKTGDMAGWHRMVALADALKNPGKPNGWTFGSARRAILAILEAK